MISVEDVSRVLNHFNIAFTESAVLGYLQREVLRKAPRIDKGYHSRFSKYNFSVDRESLVKFLIERGETEKEINSVLPA
ncbi:hypothetical protein M670_03843 [Schinkia azotoformans MEV2011]|uniref:Uncharacterized protein n=1 Tax=Schinkia azotoformans MEV2011 TaxID=1348973 RepID=A0A072NGT9_SCHAZ|nr:MULTISPECIES: hypothetical protein [Bacillaceae]KEF36929.1 hypothetical protein M670_03843 [Schinkia azotoformans MEV2011]MEC1724503.1 hypothetical protein [Schinkia azotoformans]